MFTKNLKLILENKQQYTIKAAQYKNWIDRKRLNSITHVHRMLLTKKMYFEFQTGQTAACLYLSGHKLQFSNLNPLKLKPYAYYLPLSTTEEVGIVMDWDGWESIDPDLPRLASQSLTGQCHPNGVLNRTYKIYSLSPSTINAQLLLTSLIAIPGVKPSSVSPLSSLTPWGSP